MISLAIQRKREISMICLRKYFLVYCYEKKHNLGKRIIGHLFCMNK